MRPAELVFYVVVGEHPFGFVDSVHHNTVCGDVCGCATQVDAVDTCLVGSEVAGDEDGQIAYRSELRCSVDEVKGGGG